MADLEKGFRKEMRKILKDASQVLVKEVARGTGREVADTIRAKIKRFRKKQELREQERERQKQEGAHNE